MIIRGYIACATCDHSYVVRIGMGQGVQQRHHFACRKCGEQIGVGLDVDYDNISAEVILGDNAKSGSGETDSIVNLEANFLIPVEDQGRDFAFPRLFQGHAMVQEAIRLREARGLPSFPEPSAASFRPDYSAEWGELQRAWSLHRNKQLKLSRKAVERANTSYYAADPVTDLADWVWRFSTKLTQPAFESRFELAVNEFKKSIDAARNTALVRAYNSEISLYHGRIYFDLIRAYMASFDEFAQVHFIVASGLPDVVGLAASNNFDSVRMFYGTCFESLGSLADFPAYLNNLISGRPYEQFEKLLQTDYLKLDKSSRFNPFSKNVALAEVFREADSQLRNASHHNSFDFDRATQTIRYRVGKGAQGEERQISYTEYLTRCEKIFLQCMVLLRMELVFSSQTGSRPPL